MEREPGAVVYDPFFIEGFARELWEVRGQELLHHIL